MTQISRKAFKKDVGEKAGLGVKMRETVVLAYSGGLDTSVSTKWIKEKYSADVITVTLDVGQQDDLKAVEEKAKSLGS